MIDYVTKESILLQQLFLPHNSASNIPFFPEAKEKSFYASPSSRPWLSTKRLTSSPTKTLRDPKLFQSFTESLSFLSCFLKPPWKCYDNFLLLLCLHSNRSESGSELLTASFSLFTNFPRKVFHSNNYFAFPVRDSTVCSTNTYHFFRSSLVQSGRFKPGW